jgi:hypothetical protein
MANASNTAIACGVVFKEIAGEHYACVRDPRHDVSRGVAGTELHELDLTLAKVKHHLLGKCKRGPSKAGDALRILEQARKSPILGIPVLLSALDDKAVGLFSEHAAPFRRKRNTHSGAAVSRRGGDVLAIE